MKDSQGLDLIPDLLACREGLRVVVLTSDETPHSVQKALQAGAAAYVMRCDPEEAIMMAIAGDHEGSCYVGPHAATQLAEEVATGSLEKPLNVAAVLSKRELEAFSLLGTSYAIKEIAGILRTSVKTVETYQLRIKQKLRLEKTSQVRSSAARFLKEQKQIQIDD